MAAETLKDFKLDFFLREQCFLWTLHPDEEGSTLSFCLWFHSPTLTTLILTNGLVFFFLFLLINEMSRLGGLFIRYTCTDQMKCNGTVIKSTF